MDQGRASKLLRIHDAEEDGRLEGEVRRIKREDKSKNRCKIES